MEYLFLILLLISIICGLIGMINPNFLQKYLKKTLTRKQNILIYGLVALVSFVGVGITAPATPTEEMVVNSISPDIETSVLNEKTKVEDILPLESDKVAEQISVSGNSLYPVIRVIDGDTIEVLIDNEKKTVRYIGIDTPETVHPSKPVECFGLEASNRNKELVAGKSVRLVKDVSDTDKYGRLLRYVYVGDLFVNLDLVQSGYANASSYPPDVAFNELFRTAEQEARTDKRGLWGDTCEVFSESLTPLAPSITTTSETQTTSSSQCNIKGNINSDDEKIYHVIGCGSYSKTKIDESAGEKWFCTEQEALDSGWRKALNC